MIQLSLRITGMFFAPVACHMWSLSGRIVRINLHTFGGESFFIPHESIFLRQIHPCLLFVKSNLCPFRGQFCKCFFSKMEEFAYLYILQV